MLSLNEVNEPRLFKCGVFQSLLWTSVILLSFAASKPSYAARVADNFEKHSLEYSDPNGDLLELIQAIESPSYFISPSFEEATQEAIIISDKALGDRLHSVIDFEFQGLKLGMGYEHVLSFAHKKGLVCQSLLTNFHSFSGVINAPVSGKNKEISQAYIPCGLIKDMGFDPQMSFSFTPAGRLQSYGFEFWSEDLAIPVMKDFEKKWPSDFWKFNCKQNSSGDCVQGYMSLHDHSDISIRLEYDNITGKKYKDGKMQYRYEIGVSSEVLKSLMLVRCDKL